jgi:hypothetical protein
MKWENPESRKLVLVNCMEIAYLLFENDGALLLEVLARADGQLHLSHRFFPPVFG